MNNILSSSRPFGGSSTLHDFSSPEVDKIVPISFILAPSGTYKDQHHRSWENNRSLKAINEINDSIRRTNATKVSPTMVSAAGGLLAVSGQSQGNVLIPNGWGTQRGIFILGLDFYMRNGEINRYYVQGMTDSGEFTDRNIAPNLTFYVNNVMMLRPLTRTIAGVSGAAGWTLSKNYQPLTRFGDQVSEANAPLTTLVRPRDMFARLSNSQMRSTDGFKVVDDSIKLGGADMSTSKRTNSIPSTMAARVMN